MEWEVARDVLRTRFASLSLRCGATQLLRTGELGALHDYRLVNVASVWW